MSAKFKLTFPYKIFKVKPFPSSKRSVEIKRPLIPLMVMYRKRFVNFMALLDTGADYNVFHGDIATYLGIRLTKGSRRNISGISGNKIKGYQHPVRLKVGSHQFKTNITFSNQIPDNALAVLGNKGFFDQFSIEFNYTQGFIKLSN